MVALSSTARTAILAAVMLAWYSPAVLALQVHHPVSSDMAAPHDLEEALLLANKKVSLLSEEAAVPETIRIHVHFHKAGGTLMCNLARAAGEVTPMPEEVNCNWKNHDGLRASGNRSMFPSCADRRAYYKKLGLTYSQMEREVVEGDFCDGITYSCLFRDPIDLITSNINYEETHNYGPGHSKGDNCSVRIAHLRKLMAEGVSEAGNEYDTMPGLVPTLGWKFMDNMQTRLLSGAIDVPPGQITKEHLEIAKQRLARFHAVARLEDLKNPTKRSLFFARMGWSVTLDDAADDNPAEHVEKLSAEDKLFLRQLNKYDYELIRSIN